MNRDNSGIPKFAGGADTRKTLEYVNSVNAGVIEVHSIPPTTLLRTRHGDLAPMQMYIEKTKVWEEWVTSVGGLFVTESEYDDEPASDPIDRSGMYFFLPNKAKDKYRIKRL